MKYLTEYSFTLDGQKCRGRLDTDQLTTAHGDIHAWPNLIEAATAEYDPNVLVPGVGPVHTLIGFTNNRLGRQGDNFYTPEFQNQV